MTISERTRGGFIRGMRGGDVGMGGAYLSSVSYERHMDGALGKSFFKNRGVCYGGISTLL